MASFATVEFSVKPVGDNNSFFPGISTGADGTHRYQCRAHFASKSIKNAMRGKLSIIGHIKRSLGTQSYNVHCDSGFGSGTLVIPSHGGTTISVPAVLESFEAPEGYGREAVDQHFADLSFVCRINPAV